MIVSSNKPEEKYMNEDVQKCLDRYSIEIKELYAQLRTLIYDNVPRDIEEKLWARLPSYYVGKFFVRLIPFKDHINIEALAIASYKEKLIGYQITTKGMLQISLNQNIPSDILKKIFIETLDG